MHISYALKTLYYSFKTLITIAYLWYLSLEGCTPFPPPMSPNTLPFTEEKPNKCVMDEYSVDQWEPGSIYGKGS